MNLKSLLTLIVLLVSTALSAQNQEFGLMIGASNYHGDLADEVELGETHVSGGLFYRYNFNEFWTYKPMLSYIQISGTDANSETNRLRNLSFKSDIFEWSNTIELNFQPFSPSPFHEFATFYAFAGVSLYYHNPKAELNGEWYELQPMNTENRPKKNQYKRFQVGIPFGGGFKLALTPNFVTSVEIGWRGTFTDYLDDVSTVYPETSPNMTFTNRSGELGIDNPAVAEPGDMRGDPNFNDWYIQAGITLAYRLTPIRCWATR